MSSGFFGLLGFQRKDRNGFLSTEKFSASSALWSEALTEGIKSMDIEIKSLNIENITF